MPRNSRYRRNPPSHRWHLYRAGMAREGGDAARYRVGTTRAAMQLYELQRLTHELQMLRMVVAESNGRDEAAAILNRALLASDLDWLEALRATPKEIALNAAIEALPVLPYPQIPERQLLISAESCVGTCAEPQNNFVSVPVTAETRENLPSASADLVVQGLEKTPSESIVQSESVPSLISIRNEEIRGCQCGDEYDAEAKNVAEKLDKVALGWRTASECCICLDAFQEAEPVLHMPCFHSYHPGCIKEWLQHQHSCPVCRHDLLKLAPAAGCGADHDDATVPTVDNNSFSDGSTEEEEEEGDAGTGRGDGRMGSFSSEAAVVGLHGRVNTSDRRAGDRRAGDRRRHRSGNNLSREATSHEETGSNESSSSSSSSGYPDTLTTLLLGMNRPGRESTLQQGGGTAISTNLQSESIELPMSSSTARQRPLNRTLSRAAATSMATPRPDSERPPYHANGPVSFLPLRSLYASRAR